MFAIPIQLEVILFYQMIATLEGQKWKNERVYMLHQWLDIIKQAQKQTLQCCNVSGDRSMFLNFSTHFAPPLKKMIKNAGKALNIQRARVLDYSVDHVSEVWVKYTLMDDEEWSIFSLLKAHAVPSLPALSSVKYDRDIVSDIQKIVLKYVPSEFQSFYGNILADDASSETDKSDD